MNYISAKITRVLILTLCLGYGCSEAVKTPSERDLKFEKDLQTQLIKAKPGAVINLPSGEFLFTNSLSLTVDNITLKGQGSDKTILSFQSQKSGAEGLLINANDFTLQGLAILDTKGDGVKVNRCENLIIRDVRVEWTNGPDENNGAYGLYPVQCTNVLIEDSTAIGASDAGIYVGQSSQIIVRRNTVQFNVAGIEIENSSFADVYANKVQNNAGGILVFDLPNLPVQGGRSTRVFNNFIYNNNTDNFASKGNIVSKVPSGTGLMIFANDQVEVFNNSFRDNKTTHLLINSYLAADIAFSDPNYDPYPEQIYVYNNQFQGGGDNPSLLELKALKLAMGLERLPDIIWDGWFNPEKSINGNPTMDTRLCLNNNGKMEFLNLDLANDSKNIRTDTQYHLCQYPHLPKVTLAFEARLKTIN